MKHKTALSEIILILYNKNTYGSNNGNNIENKILKFYSLKGLQLIRVMSNEITYIQIDDNQGKPAERVLRASSFTQCGNVKI